MTTTELLRDELASLYHELRTAETREDWKDIQMNIRQVQLELEAAEAAERNELELAEELDRGG